MSEKSFVLDSGNEDGWHWSITVGIKENGEIRRRYSFNFYDMQEIKEKYKEKVKIRGVDNMWVLHNIPSSIAWKTVIHHDWSDGGRMYLLTKGEHSIKTTEERKNE